MYARTVWTVCLLFFAFIFTNCQNRKAVVSCVGDEACNTPLLPQFTQKPYCILSIENNEVEQNTSFEITLSVFGDYTSASVNGQDTIPIQGKANLALLADTLGPDQVKGEAKGPGGTATCEISYTVVAGTPAPTAPECNIFALGGPFASGDAIPIILQVTVGTASSAKINNENVTLESGKAGLVVIAPAAAGLKPILGEVTNDTGTSQCTGSYSVLERPACTLEISPNSLDIGEEFEAVLTVTAGDATEGFIGEQPILLASDTYTLPLTASGPAETKELSAFISGPGGSNTCDAEYTVTDPPPPIPPIQVGNYFRATFDNSLLTDSSNPNRTGTANGSAVSSASSVKGNAASLSDANDSHVRFTGVASSFAQKSGLTLSAWIHTSDPKRQWIYYQISGLSVIGLRQEDGAFNCGLRASDERGIDLTTGTKYADGTWHQVVCVFKDGLQQVYVDGVLKRSGSIEFNISKLSFSSGSSMYIGSYRYSTVNSFNGKIDEVNLWNRALSADEVLDIYQSPQILP